MKTQFKHKTWKLAGGLALALAAGTGGAQAQYGSASVDLNGQPLATAVPPVIRSGSTLVPMRDIFEALGATVVWNNRTQEITAQKDVTRIWLQIGNRSARVGDDQRWLSQAPEIYSGSTLVPLRFVSEALGAEVNWDGSRRLVSITTPGYNGNRRPGRERDRNRDRNRDRDRDRDRRDDVRGSITVPANAVVPVTLDQTLSSATARVGDTFTATVKSEQEGDSEFPVGTQLRGRVTEVRVKTDGSPGILGLEFYEAILPNNRNVALRGDLISLDGDNVTRQSDGRIIAAPGKGGTDVKVVGIGAAAGFVLGKVLDKNSLITSILGAAGGYLYDRSRDKGKEREAVVSSGTTLGVRLTQSVTYTDTSDYWRNRQRYVE